MRTGTKTVPSTWCIFNVTGHLFTFLVVLSLICLVTTQILIFGNKTILLLEQHPMSDHAHPAHPPSHKHTHTHAHAHTHTHTHAHTHTHQQKGHYLLDDLSPSHLQPTYKHILHTVLWHFQRCWQREFVNRSKASFVGDNFLHSHDLNVWYCGEKFNACHS